MNEPELIESLRRRVALPRRAGLVLGIGDDCAIVRPRGASEDWLYTTDMLIEGTHFRRETHRAADVGWKALARGLSDIAAMGGEARFCLLSLAVAGWVDARMGSRILRRAAGAGGPCRDGVDRRGPRAHGPGDVRHRGGGYGAARDGATAGRGAGRRCDLRFGCPGRVGAGPGVRKGQGLGSA